MADASPPIRVLHLTAGSDAGGLSRYIHDLSQAMRQQGHQVAIAGEHGAWHELFERSQLPWLDMPLKGGPLALLRSTRQLRKHLRQHPVDITHVHYRRPMLVARRVPRSLRGPLLYTVHLTDIALRAPMRWLTDFGDHVHAPSAAARDWLIRQARVPADRISVIRHGIHIEQYPPCSAEEQHQARQALNLPIDAVIAGFVGRFDIPKNESWMLDVAGAARRRGLNAHVVMAGGGLHEPELRRRIAHERLESCVTVLGYIDPRPVYQAADCLMLPSAREGFSYVCAEAMSTGRPVLRTRTAGTEETVIEGVTGRSAPIQREAFVEAAVAMLADSPALARMGQAAAQHVRQHLTFQRQMQETLSLYRTLINSR
ncbi:MAG: glycosyltransferase family 4 protein [Phycisphaeraceae bacterium]